MKAKQFKRILLLVLMIISIMVPMLLLSSDGQVSALPGRFTPHFALAISGSGTKNDPYIWGNESGAIVPLTISNVGTTTDTFVIDRVDCPSGYTYEAYLASLQLDPGETGTFSINLYGGAALKPGQTQEADYTVYVANEGEPTYEVHSTIYTICRGEGGNLPTTPGNLSGNSENWPLVAGIVGAIAIIGIAALLYTRRH